MLAHELKAPLNAVEGYLNILRTTEADQNLQMVERSIVRVDGMKKLIMDLLDLTRIESGQRERVVKRLDLRAAGQGVDGAVRRRRRPPGHHRDARGRRRRRAPRRPRRGRDRLQQPHLERRQVQPRRRRASTSRSARKGDAVKVTVRDTGIGLTAEEAAKLFNEFTRIKNEQTVKILGSGLGLSTVRKIANMYDGEATVTSEPGVGSTFTVTLRDAPPAGSVPTPEPAVAAAIARRRRSSDGARGVRRTPRSATPPVPRSGTAAGLARGFTRVRRCAILTSDARDPLHKRPRCVRNCA